jgi:hypothetical protein
MHDLELVAQPFRAAPQSARAPDTAAPPRAGLASPLGSAALRCQD